MPLTEPIRPAGTTWCAPRERARTADRRRLLTWTPAGAVVGSWRTLCDAYRRLGHVVEVVEPLPDVPHPALAAAVVDGRVLGAPSAETDRGSAFLRWFARNGCRAVRPASHPHAGQGDYLLVRDRLLAGHSDRTGLFSHAEAQEFLQVPVTQLTLVDPRFPHLDTALTVLCADEVMYYPGAFSPGSRAVLRRLFPDALLATEADARAHAFNAFSDGRHVLLPATATAVMGRLRSRGYEPMGLDLPALDRHWGIKRSTLELRAS
ncbi:dimethylarginine dimethylaminohydrolase family protein [Streptomyces sp. NPDC001852]|uniref:dimethylarginine dimethylaminohydrolase family protein n=1 Tax=Streptomyces sp. NPDC001852 TaxID=3364619 RepID=UPI0036B676C2